MVEVIGTILVIMVSYIIIALPFANWLGKKIKENDKT